MTTWDSTNCGGYPSVKVVNPDGTNCQTIEKDLNAGETLVWSEEGDDFIVGSCSTIVVTPYRE